MQTLVLGDVVVIFGPQALALLGEDASGLAEDFLHKCPEDYDTAPTLHPGGVWSHDPPHHRHTNINGTKVHVLPHWTVNRQKVLAVYADNDWPALNRKQQAQGWIHWPQRNEG